MSGRNPPLIFQIAVDNSGTPVPGAALYHYVTNTTVPKAIFYDFELTTPCPQPLIADTEGRYPQYFLEDGQYTFVEYDAPLPAGVQLRPPAHHIEGVNGDAYTLPVATDDTLGGVKGGGDVTIDPDGTMHVDYGGIPGPDLALLDPDTMVVQQLTGVGAGLLPVVTDFSFPHNPGPFPPSQSGGRGIAAGRSYVGGVQVASWCAQANRGDLFWTFDYWATSVQDQSLSTAFPSGTPNWNSLAFVYMARFSKYAWIAGDASNPTIYYALHEPASYNANGSIKVAAWGTIAYPPGVPNQPADFATAGNVTCWVGDDLEVARTADFLTFTSPLTLPSTPGGIATDSYGNWLVVCRDSGLLYQSNDDAVTWSLMSSFFVDGVAAAALPTNHGEQWSSILGAYGLWVAVNFNPAPDSFSYVWSEDGLHWNTYTGTFQAFYSAGFDGVRFYGTNIASGATTSIYQLLVSSIPVHRRLAMEKGFASAGPNFLADLPGAKSLETDQNGKIFDGGEKVLKADLADDTDPAKGAGLWGYRGRNGYERLSEVVYAKDYGVVADGVTNDRAAMLIAIAAAAGRELVLPYGTTLIEGNVANLLSVANISIRGAGRGKSVLYFKSTSAYPNCFAVTGDNVRMEALTIRVEVGDNGALGINFTANSTEHEFFDIEIDGFLSRYGSYGNRCHGVLVEDAITVTRVNFTDCYIHGCGYGLFTRNTFDGLAQDWSFIGCHFWDNLADDLEFNSNNNPNTTWQDINVIGCFFDGAGRNPSPGAAGFAIGIDSGKDIYIGGNRFRNYARVAVHVEDYNQGVSVIANSFRNNVGAIEVYEDESYSVKVEGNNIDGTLAVALDSDPSTYSDPSAIDSGSFGIYVRFPGISSSSSNISVRNNTVTRCNVGIVPPYDRGGVVEENQIANCNAAFWYVASNMSRVRNNRAVRCKYGVFATTLSIDYNTFEDCYLFQYGKTGIVHLLEGLRWVVSLIVVPIGPTTVNIPIFSNIPSKVADGVFTHTLKTYGLNNYSLLRATYVYNGTTETTAVLQKTNNGQQDMSGAGARINSGTFALGIFTVDPNARTCMVDADLRGSFQWS